MTGHELRDGPGDAMISVVVPVLNERDNVAALHEALTWALRGMRREYEIVIVDDGSDDGTGERLRELAAADPRLRVATFRRNHGQTAAMTAGFDLARGQIVVTLDGDLQNDPADIPRLVATLERGYDIVCGWRRFRKDRFATRLLPSRLANLLISWVTKVPIHDTGCSLRAYRSWVIRSLTLYSEMHRFIAALSVGLGARVAEIPVRHHPRRRGQSKYGLGRIFRVLADLVTIKMLIQFAAHPIRWFTLLALPLMFGALLLFAISVLQFGDKLQLAERFDVQSIAAAAVTTLVASNIVLLGFLAELQLKASRFFRRHVNVIAQEASR